MDLNKLYHDHQVAQIRANAASCEDDRLSNEATAADLGRQIASAQSSLGAAAAAAWTAMGCAKALASQRGQPATE